MKTRSIIVLVVLFIFVSNTKAIAQSKTEIGISTIMEGNYDALNTQAYGLSVEKSFSKHWSYETGLYYKKYIYSVVYINYFSIPMSLNFNSKIVNLGVGVDAYFFNNIDFNKDLNYLGTVYYESSNVSLFSILSKDISLTKKFVLEPSLKLNMHNPINDIEFNLGVGLKLKYTL